MVNTNKLKAVFVENNLNYFQIANRLGITTQSLSMKVNNKREFKVSEIINIYKMLNLSLCDFYTIFFENCVESKSTYA